MAPPAHAGCSTATPAPPAPGAPPLCLHKEAPAPAPPCSGGGACRRAAGTARMRRMRAVDGRWGCTGSARRGRGGLTAAGSGRRGGAAEFAEAGGGQEGWRGQSRGSLQQLAERYADLAASHSEALRQREEEEWHNARLRLENARLRLENRRLRRENRSLFHQALLGPGSGKPAAADPSEEVEALRAQLGRLQEKHRRALQHLRRCRAAGGPEASELDELLEEDEQPLEKRSLVPPV
ncbi:tumor suppressor candidate gene 1 protein [Patagioenas fasciata]|uniref:tumor suppressor candidate gene 1 protein n=1 Tax=Patagioenas fasciata TaxID=372321 RepID=UPI0032E8AFF5